MRVDPAREHGVTAEVDRRIALDAGAESDVIFPCATPMRASLNTPPRPSSARSVRMTTGAGGAGGSRDRADLRAERGAEWDEREEIARLFASSFESL